MKVNTKALKKYKAKLRKAKAEVYTNRYDVNGTACLDPTATLAVVRARVSIVVNAPCCVLRPCGHTTGDQQELATPVQLGPSCSACMAIKSGTKAVVK